MKKLFRGLAIGLTLVCLLASSAVAVTPADIDAMFDMPYERVIRALQIPDNLELLNYAWDELTSMDGTFGYSDMLMVYTEALLFLQEQKYDRAAENFASLSEHASAKKFDEFLVENQLVTVADLYNYANAKNCEKTGRYKEAELCYQATSALDANSSLLDMRRTAYPQAYSTATTLFNKGEYKRAYEIFNELSRVEYEDSADWRDKAAKKANVQIEPEKGSEPEPTVEPPVGLDYSWPEDQEITLKWRPVTDAQFYAVYRSLRQNGDYEEIGITRETTYTDAQAPLANCYYKIGAIAGEEEALSDWLFVPYVEKMSLEGPQNLSHRLNGESVLLSWDAVKDATGYSVYRAPDTSGLATQLAFTRNLTHTDNYKRYKDYYYKVDGRVNNANLGSDWLLVKYERPTLSMNSTGDAVRVLQAELIERNYLYDVADGKFGKKTEAAVKALQRDANLPETGVVDADTWEALYKHTATHKSQSNRSASLYRAEPVEDPVELQRGVVLFFRNTGSTQITQIVINAWLVDSNGRRIGSLTNTPNSGGVTYYTSYTFTVNVTPGQTVIIILPDITILPNGYGIEVEVDMFVAGGSRVNVSTNPLFASLGAFSTSDTWSDYLYPDSWSEETIRRSITPKTETESYPSDDEIYIIYTHPSDEEIWMPNHHIGITDKYGDTDDSVWISKMH